MDFWTPMWTHYMTFKMIYHTLTNFVNRGETGYHTLTVHSHGVQVSTLDRGHI